jgi:hypothetical protein
VSGAKTCAVSQGDSTKSRSFGAMDTEKTAVVLAALRHLQADMVRGTDLIDLSEIIDPGLLAHFDIDGLCEDLNTEPVVETYRTMVLSTGHLSRDDASRLKSAADDPGETMVMAREYGYFVKLYSCDGVVDSKDLLYCDNDSFGSIVRYAVKHGYQLIEFDRDANTYHFFPTYDW